MPLDAQYKATGRAHAGLILVSTKAFPQDRTFVGAVVGALDVVLSKPDGIGADRVVFLSR